MKQFILFNFFALTALVSINAGAQSKDTLRWNLNECFQYASGHNIQINTLLLNQESAKQDWLAAKASRIPDLNAIVSNTFNNSNINDGNSVLVNQISSNGVYSLNSAVTIWNRNAINNTVKANQLVLQSQGLLIQQSFNNIQLQITQAYLNILLSKENLTYITDLVNTTQALVRKGQQFFTVGSIAKKDLLELQAQLAGDLYLQVQARNAIRQELIILKQILQLPPDNTFDIVSPDTIEVKTVLPPLDEVRQRALSNFPDVKIGYTGVEIAAANINIVKARFVPELSAYGVLSSGNKAVLTHNFSPKTNYFTQVGDNFYQQLGFSLSIPVFSNRINKTNLEKARIAYRQASLNLENDQLLLSETVEQYYINVENAMQSFRAAEEQLKAATESYRIVNEQFRLGGATIYDVLQQRNQYVQSFQQYVQAKYGAILNQEIYLFYNNVPIRL